MPISVQNAILLFSLKDPSYVSEWNKTISISLVLGFLISVVVVQNRVKLY